MLAIRSLRVLSGTQAKTLVSNALRNGFVGVSRHVQNLTTTTSVWGRSTARLGQCTLSVSSLGNTAGFGSYTRLQDRVLKDKDGNIIPNKTNDEKIFEHSGIAMKRGDKNAIYMRAMCFLLGRGTKQDVAQGMSLLRKNAEDGHGVSINKMARITSGEERVRQNGRLVRDYINEAEGFQWAKDAAELGYPESMTLLGAMYIGGKGTTTDNTQGISWLEKAAQQGYARAQGMLGLCYKQGKGVEMDLAMARTWLEKAAAAKNPDGMWGLAELLMAGHAGLERDEKKAHEMMENAAKLGSPMAMLYMGNCHMQECTKNYKEETAVLAVRYFETAADLGVPRGFVDLGMAYLNGFGVGQSDEKAVEMFQRAALADDPHGHYFLAMAYLRGKGIAADQTLGMQHLRRASRHVPEAKRLYERLKLKGS